MTDPPGDREIQPPEPFTRRTEGGRRYVVVIGIDRYRGWSQLHNAVRDAQGARDAFVKLGFTEHRPALINDDATGPALHRLVTDELRTLGNNDSLVLFFAGHGHTLSRTYEDGTVSKLGYLLPVDAGPPGSGIGSWVCLDSWLHNVAHLPPRHILVVLDACNSGVALNPVIRWRGEDVRGSEPLAKLRARRSRRIITSALDDELAMDGGPIEGHSLFTGCLIEALTGGLLAKTRQSTATGSEIALHVQRRVSSFPSSKQTPDFGALELDNRGELIIDLTDPLLHRAMDSVPTTGGIDTIQPRNRPSGSAKSKDGHRKGKQTPTPGAAIDVRSTPASGVDSIRPKRAMTAVLSVKDNSERSSATSEESQSPRDQRSELRPELGPPTPPASTATSIIQPAEVVKKSTPASALSAGLSADSSPSTTQPGRSPITSAADPAAGEPKDRTTSRATPLETAFMAALDRHQLVRAHKRRVLTLVTADPTTGMTGWGSWAAVRGRLTLATDVATLGGATASLLDQMPWLRVLAAARARFAAAAKLDVTALDEALDHRSSSDREGWIEEVAGHDMHARVAGWLLSMIREPWGRVPDLASAPVLGGDLLATLDDLEAPIAVLLHHPEPTASWLERAIQTASELVDLMPRRAIAVSAPGELVESVTHGHAESAAIVLAAQGKVPLAARGPRTAEPGCMRATQMLHTALARDRRTAGLFEPHVAVPTHDRDRAVEVDLIARDALLAIEIDDWYQTRDPKAYARDRVKDRWLSRAQFFVMRFLVEDVEERIEQTVNEIAIGLAGRRASGSFVESPQ